MTPGMTVNATSGGLLPPGAHETARMMANASPTNLADFANDGFLRKESVTRLVEILNPRRIGQIGGVGTTAVAGKAFLSLNINTVVASGSIATIATASLLVVGAVVAGYGLGTLIDRQFHLSEKIADAAYKWLHGS